jgi:uncharacterized SAM-binding protein YcdF (DUF218 family)
MGLGIAMTSLRRRKGLIVTGVGFCISLFFSMPLTVNWMTKHLESIPAATDSRFAQAQAIVILGGGQRGIASEYGTDMPSKNTLERLLYGAYLGRKTALPILVTGGNPGGGRPEAEVMADVLNTHFGITAKWMETGSPDTRGNARLSAPILKNNGITTIALVTDAAHMRRSVYEFSGTGLVVIPAPTSFFSDDMRPPKMFGLIPDIQHIYMGYYAAHEWAGILAQHIRDLI